MKKYFAHYKIAIRNVTTEEAIFNRIKRKENERK